MGQSTFQSPFGKIAKSNVTSISSVTSNQAQSSPFEGSMSGSPAPSFRAAQLQPSFGTSNINMQEKTPRDILVEFYQSRKPSKVNEIPMVNSICFIKIN